MSLLKYTYDSIAGAGKFCKLQVTGGRKLSDICHTHDFYEIVLMLRGEMGHEINGINSRNQTGDYVIIRPGDYHRIVSQSKEASVICLSVKKSEFEKLANAFDVECLCDFSPENNVEIRNIGEDYTFCSKASEKGFGENGEVYCKRLLSIILTNYAASSTGKQVFNSEIYRIAEKMKKTEHLREGLSAFLRLSGYSHTHLARLVKREFGCTLHEYIFKLRLEEAHRRVVYTGEHLESIAQNVGYESFSHFNRIFKSYFGITPAALRKKHGFSTV